MVREARFPALAIALAIACGDSPREIAPSPPPPKPSVLEQSIASQLSAKLGRPATVSCVARACRADLGDAVLPLTVSADGSGSTWTVDGLLVRAAPIEAYLAAALRDLGAPQGVTCGARLRSVAPGDRIECALERGGKAFATIAADGSFSTEIDLDPAAAAARSSDSRSQAEPVGPPIEVPDDATGEHSDDD